MTGALMDYPAASTDTVWTRVVRRLVQLWHSFLTGFRFVLLGLSVTVLTVSLVISYFVAAPAIQRWRDLASYMSRSSPSASTEDERLVERLRKVMGSDSNTIRNIRVLSGFTNVDLGDTAIATVQANEFGDTPPGGDLYWIPRTGSIYDSYGLLMATLIDNRKNELLLDAAIQNALHQFLDAASVKSDSLNKHTSETRSQFTAPSSVKPQRQMDGEIRAAATLLKQRLGRIPISDDLLKDFVQYVGLSDAGTQPIISLPELQPWLSTNGNPMEQIVAGELTVTTFDSQGTSKTQPIHVSATVFGRSPHLLKLQRPPWFKYKWIELGRSKASGSNAFARFFGPYGDLSDIPDSIFAIKEPTYVLQVAKDDADRLAAALADNSAAIVVQYPGGKVIASASAATRVQNTLFWQLKPTQAKVSAVALVSRIY